MYPARTKQWFGGCWVGSSLRIFWALYGGFLWVLPVGAGDAVRVWVLVRGCRLALCLAGTVEVCAWWLCLVYSAGM